MEQFKEVLKDEENFSEQRKNRGDEKLNLKTFKSQPMLDTNSK
jgi:hypothetical protein